MTSWITISCHCHNGIVSVMGMPDDCRDCNGSGRIWVTDKDRLAQYPGGPFLGYEPGLFMKEMQRGKIVQLQDGVWNEDA